MVNKVRGFLFSLLLIALSSAAVTASYIKIVSNENIIIGNQTSFEPKREYTEFHSAYSLQAELYGDMEERKEVPVFSSKVYGGTVSHHFLMAKEIAEFFAPLREQKIKTVVIVGPNHFNLGKSNIQVSALPYKTPWSEIYPDGKIIDKLVQDKVAVNFEAAFSREHSISTLVGFVKYYLPDAKIVPIILKKTTPKEQAEKLSQELTKILPGNSLVLSSVDFSHHLNVDSADYHDVKSISAIGNFDYDGLFRSEIDSPMSVYVLLKYLETKDAKHLNYSHFNSADILQNPQSDDVTSYVFSHFTKGASDIRPNASVLNFGPIVMDDQRQIVSFQRSAFEKIKGVEGNFFRGMDIITTSARVPYGCGEKDRKDASTLIDVLKKENIHLLSFSDKEGMDCTDSESRILQYDGVKVGLVTLDEITTDQQQYISEIIRIKDQVDAVLVYVDWLSVEKNTAKQKELSHALIDSGADAVLGYADSLKEVELYNNRPIFYSLGNFLSKDENTAIGVGTIVNDISLSFYVFPFMQKQFGAQLQSSKKTQEFCVDYLHKIGEDYKERNCAITIYK